MTSLIRRVEDLVVENREIQRKAKTDWVSRCKVSGGHFGGSFVGFQGFVGRGLALIAKSKFGEVAVIVAFPRWKLVLCTCVWEA